MSTAALLAKYEDVMCDGRIERSSIQITGAPAENRALFSHPAHLEKVLVIYNEAAQKPLKFTADLKRKYRVAGAVDETPLGELAQITGEIAAGDYQAYILR